MTTFYSFTLLCSQIIEHLKIDIYIYSFFCHYGICVCPLFAHNDDVLENKRFVEEKDMAQIPALTPTTSDPWSSAIKMGILMPISWGCKYVHVITYVESFGQSLIQN